jgi:glucan phosphoethanolaminetransferase (alkaline phosphatase superfamily)
MSLTGIIQGLNKYEGLFGKLGILTVLVFLLLVLAGYTSGPAIGKVMTTVLLFLILMIMYFGYEVNKDLNE